MAHASAKKGFTLVELMIVIVIIGILTTVSAATYAGLQARARTSAADTALANANKKIATYKIFNRAYPPTLAAAEITNDTSVVYQYTNNTTTYCITASAGNVDRYTQTGANPAAGTCAGHAAGTGVGVTK